MRYFVFFILYSLFFILYSIPVNAATLTVCPSGCTYAGGDGIQQAIDAAKDGDTISIASGEYTRKPPSADTKCFIDTKGKNITIKGEGFSTLLNSQNDGHYYKDLEGLSRFGVCINGGEVVVDSLAIKQSTKPAIDIREAQAVVKNIQFIDIDNGIIDVRQSNVMILNNLFTGSAGPGVMLHDTSHGIIINNTFFGNGGAGITFDFCKDNAPTGEVSNNIIVNPGDLFSQPLSGSGIGADCRDQQEKVAKIKTSNNFVWKGVGGETCGSDLPKRYENCVAGEICEGSTVVPPEFNGADERCTVVVYGEGTVVGDFHTKPTSSARAAGAGFEFGPCADAGSSTCANYIKSKPFPTPTPTPTESPQPITNPGNTGSGGQGQSSFRSGGNITNIKSSIDYVLNNLKLTNEGTKETDGMDLIIYIAASAVYIMVIHFAVGIKNESNIFLMIIYFVLGGVVGGWLHTYEGGLAVSIILSLLFI